jgi:hypothetical protein
MANAVYLKYKESVLKEADANNGLDGTTTAAPYVALVDTGTYTFSSSHQFYSSLSGIVGTDQALTTPTVTNGTFDADDATFTAVSGASVEALVIYRHNTGANTTWRLVLYEDTSVTGLPVTPNGGNIVITWNASGIFTISDRDLKTNVRLVGEYAGKLGVYEYAYKSAPDVRVVGLMAQEVERVVPDAVIQFNRAGNRAVNYSRVAEALAA